LRQRMDEGDMLWELKESVDHGQWLPILAKLGIPDWRASRYMRLAKHRALVESKLDSESDFGITEALNCIRLAEEEQANNNNEPEEQATKPIHADNNDTAKAAAVNDAFDASIDAAAEDAKQAAKNDPDPKPKPIKPICGKPGPDPNPDPVEHGREIHTIGELLEYIEEAKRRGANADTPFCIAVNVDVYTPPKVHFASVFDEIPPWLIIGSGFEGRTGWKVTPPRGLWHRLNYKQEKHQIAA
jgi:hypothetical protein